MRPLVPLLSVWVLLLSGWSAAAQPSSDHGKWSGRASLTAGYGWSMPDEELALTDTLIRFRQTAEVVLRYERKKFFVSTRLSQVQDRNHTDGTKIVFSGTNDLDELTRFDMITRHSRPAQKRYEARTDIRWTPSERASFSGYAGYVDGHNAGENTVGQFKVVAEQLAFSLETVDVRQRMALSGFRGNLLLPDHKILLGGFDWTREWNWRHLQWDGIDTNLAELYRAYRLTPFFIRDRSNAFLTYRDSTLFGVPRMRFEAGSRLTVNRDNDRYGGENLGRDGNWKDSLRIKEHFDFIAAQLEPYVRLDWSRENLSVYVETGLQLYGTRLDNDTLHQALSVRPAVVVGALGGRWHPGTMHTVTWSGSWNVQRPTYQNICWYQRQGRYDNQLYQGNPELSPTRTLNAQIGYGFVYQKFHADFTSTYSRRDDEVVQTFWHQKVDNRNFTIFSWVNAARTRTFVERLGVGWRGTTLTANLSCLYHDLYQRKDLDDKDKENRYWEFAGEVQLRLPRQWTMSVNGNYHTTIRTLYQIVDPYFRLDARVEKAFGKAWMVFLDGRDLLDRPIGNGIISDIEKQNWFEETRSNRRLIQAGVTYQF